MTIAHCVAYLVLKYSIVLYNYLEIKFTVKVLVIGFALLYTYRARGWKKFEGPV